MERINIFLSYCWADNELANHICDYSKNDPKVVIHRDNIKIGKWRSIKEYMQSINDMDYAILLISDAYLKSANCMYEVLELMRDRAYRDKIFPAITIASIYAPVNRARYVKHWENESAQLEETLKDIKIQNLGKLNDDLKKYQNITSGMAEFLDVISDMNNPEIQEVARLGQQECIGVSDCTRTFGSGNNSWNVMYNSKVIDGELKLYSIMSLTNRQESMTAEEVVADIWENHVQIYL